VNNEKVGRSIGCLCIDSLGIGNSLWCVDLAGIDSRPFLQTRPEAMWDELQMALQQLHRECTACSVMGRGSGCLAALALAEQLPVDRLVLEAPAFPPRFPWHRRCHDGGGGEQLAIAQYRQARKLANYARRNLSLCASDMLVIEQDGAVTGVKGVRAIGKPANCRVHRLVLHGDCEKDLYKIREFVVKEAISRFLQTGELPKMLAENSEMCIIYG